MTFIADSGIIAKVSLYVYQTIIDIQQQQPELLKEKYKKVDWLNQKNQSTLLAKVQDELNKSDTLPELRLKISKILDVLLTDYAQSPIFIKLIEDVSFLAQLLTSNNGNTSPLNPSLSGAIGASLPEAIAILLLDVENLKLDIETETFLSQICAYPIQVKIAFANWRQMGKLDIELHERGYDLIHVPSGQDNADGKMIAVGSSLHEHYPKVREVLVCSSDKVMTNLCNHLLKTGLTVYRIFREAEQIKILNCKTGEIETNSEKKIEIPTLAQCIESLKLIIKSEQTRASDSWVKLSTISTLFKSQYKITISQVVSTHLSGKRVRDIFLSSPFFVVHQPTEQDELYITLFETNSIQLETEKVSTAEIVDKNDLQKQFSIKSSQELEQALIKVLMKLKETHPTTKVSIAILGTKFRALYKRSPKEILKQLKLNSNLSNFLKSCKVFIIQSTGDTEWVELNQDSSTTINSRTELEQALVSLYNDLMAKSKQNYLSIGDLGSAFKNHYAQAVTDVMKSLNIQGTFTQFLLSCKTFQVEKKDNKYQVILTSS